MADIARDYWKSLLYVDSIVDMKIDMNDCIHCHKCRDNCAFLSKYGLDICDTDQLKELAYHCFLCGKCTQVCPVKIDGRAIMIDLRREAAAADEAGIRKTFGGILAEKEHYKFRNYKHITSGTVFFPGCNFPSMYPKTNALMSKLFADRGIGTVYDCCGKPVAETGLIAEENRIISEISQKMKDAGVTEIILACPNCRDFFGDRLGIKVTSVYAKLAELGLGNLIDGDKQFFVPCPDRMSRMWIEDIRPFISGEITFIDGPQCCGLGGQAQQCEKEIAASFPAVLGDSYEGYAYTYCASCVGRFKRSGQKTIEHILPAIMNTGEKADTLKSYANRVMTRYK